MNEGIIAAIDDVGDALTVVYDAARSTTGVTQDDVDALREKVRHLCDSVSDSLMNLQECVDCGSYEDVNRSDRFLEPFGDDYWICPICAEKRHG